jgi:hypothetical protein
MMAVDVFVLADTFQYRRQSFQNRTRVRTPDGWQGLSVPLEGGQHGRPIAEVRVAEGGGGWKSRHWRSLEYNYRSSPFFEYYEDTIARVVGGGSRGLGEVTVASVLAVRDILEIETRVVVASAMDDVPVSPAEIARRFPGTEIATLPDAEGADLHASLVLNYQVARYPQNFGGFEAGMSILDLLFNVGPDVRRMLGGGRLRESASEETRKVRTVDDHADL